MAYLNIDKDINYFRHKPALKKVNSVSESLGETWMKNTDQLLKSLKQNVTKHETRNLPLKH